MLDPKQWSQFGYERPKGEQDIEGIVLHNTSNYEMNARQIFEWLRDVCKTSQGTHYLVDHNEVIQVMPNSWAVYSCGKGNDYSAKHLIAIEIVDNINDELYLEGQDRAISLIEDLMNEYNIPRSQIFFHSDFDNRSICPATIRRIYGTKKNFLDTFINRR